MVDKHAGKNLFWMASLNRKFVFSHSSILDLLSIYYCAFFRASACVIKMAIGTIPPQRGNITTNPPLQWYFPAWGSALQSVFCVACAIASVSRPPRDQMMMHILFAPSLTLDAFRHRTTGLNFLSRRFKSISFNSDCLHVRVVWTPSELAIFAKGRKPSCGASMGQEERVTLALNSWAATHFSWQLQDGWVM